MICINLLLTHTKSFPALLGYIPAWMGMIRQFCEYRCNPFFVSYTMQAQIGHTKLSLWRAFFFVFGSTLWESEAKGLQWVAV